MKIVVPIKLVPDLVEELVIDESGLKLDSFELILCLNEFDDHAIEQAILLKEKDGSHVTIIALGMEEADEVLFTAAAKGADELLRITGDFEDDLNNHSYAQILKPVIAELKPDLILTGVQAHNDLDGQLGPLIAEYLGFPYVGYVGGVDSQIDEVTVHKEYPGGLVAEVSVKLPAVLGIQAAEMPPRYVAFSRIRQARNTATIKEQTVTSSEQDYGPSINRLYHPKSRKRAKMIDGEADVVAAQLLSILQERSSMQRGQS
jgi:electron transfer flavoprotein beta subunit